MPGAALRLPQQTHWPVAAAADALSAQVLGLQDWARMVQGVAFEQGQRNDF